MTRARSKVSKKFNAFVSELESINERARSVFRTVALIAYACPECGYVEQYIKNLEQDREKLD